FDDWAVAPKYAPSLTPASKICWNIVVAFQANHDPVVPESESYAVALTEGCVFQVIPSPQPSVTFLRLTTVEDLATELAYIWIVAPKMTRCGWKYVPTGKRAYPCIASPPLTFLTSSVVDDPYDVFGNPAST